MKEMKSKICYILGIASFTYFIMLTSFGGKVSFSIFWILAGAMLISVGYFSNSRKDYNLEMNKMTKIIKVIKPLFNIMFLIAMLSFIIIESAIIYYGRPKNPQESHYLLILGAGLKGEAMSLTLTQRMYKSLEFLKKYPNTKVIVSGGQGPGETITEAEAMKRFLVSNGINENNIIKEDKSTNTAENFKFSKEILKQLESKEHIKISVVTTNFHMFRAKLLARRTGLDIYEFPSELHFILIPNYYVREYLAVIKSYIFDKI